MVQRSVGKALTVETAMTTPSYGFKVDTAALWQYRFIGREWFQSEFVPNPSILRAWTPIYAHERQKVLAVLEQLDAATPHGTPNPIPSDPLQLTQMALNIINVGQISATGLVFTRHHDVTEYRARPEADARRDGLHADPTLVGHYDHVLTVYHSSGRVYEPLALIDMYRLFVNLYEMLLRPTSTGPSRSYLNRIFDMLQNTQELELATISSTNADEMYAHPAFDNLTAIFELHACLEEYDLVLDAIEFDPYFQDIGVNLGTLSSGTGVAAYAVGIADDYDAVLSQIGGMRKNALRPGAVHFPPTHSAVHLPSGHTMDRYVTGLLWLHNLKESLDAVMKLILNRPGGYDMAATTASDALEIERGVKMLASLQLVLSSMPGLHYMESTPAARAITFGATGDYRAFRVSLDPGRIWYASVLPAPGRSCKVRTRAITEMIPVAASVGGGGGSWAANVRPEDFGTWLTIPRLHTVSPQEYEALSAFIHSRTGRMLNVTLNDVFPSSSTAPAMALILPIELQAMKGVPQMIGIQTERCISLRSDNPNVKTSGIVMLPDVAMGTPPMEEPALSNLKYTVAQPMQSAALRWRIE